MRKERSYTLEEILEYEKTRRNEDGMFGINACKDCIRFYLDQGADLKSLLDNFVKRANEDMFFNKAMVLACWEMLEEQAVVK